MHKQNVHAISTTSAVFIASAKENVRALIHLSEIPMKYPSTKNNAQRSYIEKFITHWELTIKMNKLQIQTSTWRRARAKPLTKPLMA